MMGLLLDNKSINKATGVHLQSLWKLKKVHSDGFRISHKGRHPIQKGCELIFNDFLILKNHEFLYKLDRTEGEVCLT